MINKFNIFFSVAWLAALAVANAQVAASSAAIDGTPYLDEEYLSGVIYYGNTSLTVPIRYNAYQDLIEYQQSGRAMVLDPGPAIRKVCFGKSTFVPLTYEFKGKSKVGYFELLDSGRMTLYSKKSILYFDVKKGGAMDGTDQPAHFRRAPDTFYYRIGDGELIEIGNIKSMIKTLPDKQDEMAEFAKKEKISPKKEEEVIQFVQYYNSLGG